MNLIFGHLVGDFMFQNNWMAMNKGGNTLKCLVHCIIYTLVVMAFTGSWTWLAAFVVFNSHFWIDRFSLADKWLQLINGRSLTDFLKNGYKNVTSNNHHVLRGGFTSVVYTVVDSTMHLLILYYLLPCLI